MIMASAYKSFIFNFLHAKIGKLLDLIFDAGKGFSLACKILQILTLTVL